MSNTNNQTSEIGHMENKTQLSLKTVFWHSLWVIPLTYAVFWFFMMNFVAEPNGTKTRIARGRAMILGEAILQYRAARKKEPEQISDVQPYLLTTKTKNWLKSLDYKASYKNDLDDPTRYFVFKIRANKPISDNSLEREVLETRQPKGTEFQAGFCRLDGGRYLIIGIGPWNEPVVFRSNKRRFLDLDSNEINFFHNLKDG